MDGVELIGDIWYMDTTYFAGGPFELAVELGILFTWMFVVIMMYKTNRNYVFMPLALGGCQILMIGLAFTQGYFSEFIVYLLFASFVFLILGIYKTAKGLRIG